MLILEALVDIGGTDLEILSSKLVDKGAAEVNMQEMESILLAVHG
jgi:hypothetical protein